jgi:chorismate dehydratase
MIQLKVATISYLNSIPFVYGLEKSDLDLDLTLDIPSVCAQKLLDNQVDLALVPIAILPQLKEYHIVGDTCIGASGKVETVCLFSDVPLSEIDTILLDYHSRTSVALIKILCKHFWKINPKFVDAKSGYENKIGSKVAGLIIGDRAYKYTEKYKYVFDLSQQWELFAQLPFVFACWVSINKLDSSIEKEFSKALNYGLSNLDKALNELQTKFDTSIDKKRYLTDVISYKLDQDKEKAMKLFLDYL